MCVEETAVVACVGLWGASFSGLPARSVLGFSSRSRWEAVPEWVRVP